MIDGTSMSLSRMKVVPFPVVLFSMTVQLPTGVMTGRTPVMISYLLKVVVKETLQIPVMAR